MKNTLIYLYLKKIIFKKNYGKTIKKNHFQKKYEKKFRKVLFIYKQVLIIQLLQ